MTAIRLGRRQNLWQFSLLVVVNAFVGAMIGLERSILPPLAEREIHIVARTAVLSFIVVFRNTKAFTNCLAGPRNRGLAMGLNEFAGYFAVAGSALATGYIAARYGLRPEHFYFGVAFVAVGLLLSGLLVRETAHHVAHESRLHGELASHDVPTQRETFWQSSTPPPGASALQWPTRCCSPRSGMSRIRRGAHRRSGCIACGEISDMPSGRCWPA